VAKLIAKTATEDLLPLTVGGLTVTDATPRRLTALSLWPGADSSADKALKAIGLGLVAIDLGPRAFPEGATARTGLGHMMALVHRSSARSFTILVFRSMAASAIHEIEGAMKALAARAAL